MPTEAAEKRRDGVRGSEEEGVRGQGADRSRRRLLTGAATAAPMILTLRSGSALAATSYCYRQDQIVGEGTESSPLSYDPETEVCLGTVGTENDTCVGTVVQGSAYHSLGGSAPNCE